MKKSIINGEGSLAENSESIAGRRDHSPEIELDTIINVEEIRSIMDNFNKLTNMVTAIVDVNGKVIEATGWQDICVKFHRAHPQALAACTESDLYLAKNLKPGEYVGYKCKSGLWDVVTPLYVANKHLGNIYTGQFFYDDEQIDEEFFIKQAETYGFDKTSYLAALRRVPKYSRETVDHLMGFLVKLTTYISKIGFANMQLEREIRERKRAEEALRESETSLRTLIRTIPDLVWLKNKQGIFLSCNSRVESLLGAKEAEIIGKTDYDFVNKEIADSFRTSDRLVMTENKPVRNEEKLVFAGDGHQEIIETIKTPMYRSDGSLAGVLGIGRDITERKLAEKERVQLMAAIEQSSDTIVITDAKAAIQYVNPAFEKVTGYTREEVLGKNPRILKSGEQDAIFYREMWQTISNGETWRGRFVNKKKDGSLLTEAASISPVFDASGAIINYVSVRRDITEYLRIEREKSKLEEQYHQSQKVESIGRLAGGVAHDLNNLLTPIIGYGEMLMDDFSPGDKRRLSVEEIVRAGSRAQDLVKQLLAFSRKQTLEYKPLDLNRIIVGIKKLLRRAIREDIQIKIVPGRGLGTVRADMGQIEQVIMNLAVNAQDAMPNGGSLTLETGMIELDETYVEKELAEETGRHVMLTVSDTGCGMDKETRKSIFEPFFTTKGKHGTGMGLATVYGIVKQHGGNIWVYSEPGKGSTFKVILPVSEEEPIEVKAVDKKGDEAKGSETILVVEDNEQVRNLTIAILKRSGYTVLVAENGKEALTILSSHDGHVDLLLTDVIMPEMNGKELFAKAGNLRPNLKVLYMSGYTDDVIAHHGVLDEGVQFIQKPFTVQDLSNKIRGVLEKVKQ